MYSMGRRAESLNPLLVVHYTKCPFPLVIQFYGNENFILYCRFKFSFNHAHEISTPRNISIITDEDDDNNGNNKSNKSASNKELKKY